MRFVLSCLILNALAIIYFVKATITPFHRVKISPSSTIRLFNQPIVSLTAEPSVEDMGILATILANITESLESSPDIAMKIVSDNVGWLYTKNVP
jgi:hypothetical protein